MYIDAPIAWPVELSDVKHNIAYLAIISFIYSGMEWHNNQWYATLLDI
jgi:hypothetical protein